MRVFPDFKGLMDDAPLVFEENLANYALRKLA